MTAISDATHDPVWGCGYDCRDSACSGCKVVGYKIKDTMPKTTPPPTLSDTLSQRGTRYGEFKDQAVYAQGMADLARTSPNWALMAPDQREGLSIIFNKIGRILNGDPDYSDSWHDIAGYATLVDKRLKAEGK